MKNKSKSLEGNLEEPDWKQWLPVLGIAQIGIDEYEGKPIIIDEKNPISYVFNTYLQAISITALAYILSCLG